MKLKVTLFSAAMLITLHAGADVKSLKVQEKVIICYFYNAGKSIKDEYLLEILPRTISKILSESKRFKLQLYPSIAPSREMNSIKTETGKRKFMELFIKKNNADYIITGSYMLDGSGISIDSVLYVNADKSVNVISDNTPEKGVRLVRITDNISRKLSRKIDALIAAKKVMKKIVKPKEEKKIYVEMHKKGKIIIRPFFTFEDFQLNLYSEERNNPVKYKPNIMWKYGVNLSISNYALYLATDSFISNLQDDEKEFGKSNSIDGELHIYRKMFGVDLLFQRYKGFYINNTGENYPGTVGSDPKVQFPDMILTSGGLNFYINFNRSRFSYSAAFDQLEVQKLSSGAFLLMASAEYLSLENSGSILPPSVDLLYRELSGLESFRLISLTLSPGFAYTIAANRFFITPSVFFGLGWQQQNIKTVTTDKKMYTALLKIYFKTVIGYNGDKFLTGISLFAGINRSQLGDSEMELFKISGTAFFGMRF